MINKTGNATPPAFKLSGQGAAENIPSFETRKRTVGMEPAIFAGKDPDLLLAPLREQEPKEVKLNRGGTSLSFRIKFEDGSKAAFKPRQRFAHSNPRREIAAFRVANLLGLDAVPPAVPRKFKRKAFYKKFVGDGFDLQFIADSILYTKDNEIWGELSWWIPAIRPAKIGGFPLDSTEGIVTTRRYLSPNGRIPKKDWNMARQVSSMLVFDYIINNPDRWSGGNAEATPDNQQLFFMDNTMSFGAERVLHEKVDYYMRRSQRFSRSLIQRLRGLSKEQFAKVVKSDIAPFKELLKQKEVEYIEKRRVMFLDYVDELIAKHGEEKVLYFP